MPQKIEVDGVGTFEVDDSFFNMTPEQQQAGIAQMAEANKQGITASEDYTGPPPEGDFKPVDPSEIKPVAIPPSEVPQAPTNGPGIATRSMGSFNEGLADTLGAPVDLVNMGLSKLGLGTDAPILGSKSISGILHKLGIGQVDETYDPQSKGEEYLQAGMRGVGQSLPGALAVPLAGARIAAPSLQAEPTLAAALKGGVKTMAREAAKKPALAVATEAGAGAGSGVGAQAAKDIFPDSEIAPVLGSILGGVTGATAVGIPGTNVSKYGVKPTTRFVNKHVEQNPYAAFDAEIAKDMKGLADDTASSPLDPKGRSVVTVKEVNNLEQGYRSRFLDMLNQVEMPGAEKMKLKQALDGKYSTAMKAVQEIRGTPAGDAFADAIVKTQRLRKLTPELQPGGTLAYLRKAADVGGIVGGSLTGGPAGGVGGYGASKIVQKLLKNPGDGEAARVNSAERLIKQAPKYDALAKVVGPSGAERSKATFEAEYADTVTAKETAKKSAELAKAQAKLDLQQLKETNARVGIENAKDNIVPSGGFRARLHQNTGLKPAEQDAAALRLLAQKKITPEQYNMFLKDPNKLQVGNAGNAIMDRMNAMADAGELPRDPTWVKSAPDAEVTSANIRNPIAYRATAEANQGRVSQTLMSVHSDTSLPEPVRQTLGEAITKLGNTSSASDADALVSATLQKLPKELKEYGARVLSPLAQQIK